MTRDEVMAMTDEELRIKAAELTDWLPPEKPEVAPDSWTYHSPAFDVEYFIATWGSHSERVEVDEMARWYFWHTADGKMRNGDAPDYPNDIAMAMGLEHSMLGEVNHESVEDSWTGPLEGWEEMWAGIRRPYREHSRTARYVEALCVVLEIDSYGLAYEDFGTVEYADIAELIHASPRDRTRAFILAMTKEQGAA